MQPRSVRNLIHLLLFVLVLAGTALPPAAWAQTYPQRLAPFVNDYADVLDPATEERIADRLKDLKQSTSIAMTLVTIDRISTYGGTGIGPFATGLFNNWGIGDGNRNDGILLLVAKEDKAVRLELGAGYPASYDWLAEDVVDISVLPHFKDGDLASGIEAGIAATIARIAVPFADGIAPEVQPDPVTTPGKPPAATEPASDAEDGWLRIGIFAAFAALIGGLMARKRLAGTFLAKRACPGCGRTGTLSRISDLSPETPGNRTRQSGDVTSCSACGWRGESRRARAMRPPNPGRDAERSSGNDGIKVGRDPGASSRPDRPSGGKSSGGGASGKW